MLGGLDAEAPPTHGLLFLALLSLAFGGLPPVLGLEASLGSGTPGGQHRARTSEVRLGWKQQVGCDPSATRGTESRTVCPPLG